MNKPYSLACERNSPPIFQQLQTWLADTSFVLEIGSGTGQHGEYFARRLPHLQWQPSDRAENLPGITLWQQESGLENLLPPLLLDVCQKNWPVSSVPAVFTANTLHIMSWQAVELFFEHIRDCLASGGQLIVYGPFNYQGRYTSDSNSAFDQHLQQRDPDSAIRNFEAVDRLAQHAGLRLQQDISMPANNRLIHWVKH